MSEDNSDQGDIDNNEEEKLEYDEEGRPLGINKLFEIISKDLGEDQSQNFRLFYDLMSNQIKYCLS
jgi:hypothetical protein